MYNYTITPPIRVLGHDVTTCGQGLLPKICSTPEFVQLQSSYFSCVVCVCVLNAILIYWCDSEAPGGLSGLSHPWIFSSPLRLSKHCSNVWPRIHWFRSELQLPIPW